MKRLALIVVVALSLLASASFELFHVSPAQERENLAQWQVMNEDERESMRRSWRSLSSLQGAQRETARRRLSTVGRVMQRRRSRTGEQVSHEELVTLLVEYPDELMSLLDRRKLPSGPLEARLEHRTRRLILSFLKGLDESGRLDLSERLGLEKLAYPDLVDRALDLQKREEIYLYAEGAEPLHPVDVISLQDLTPLDVAEEMRETRRRHGLLGRASRHFGLTETDRRWLASISDEDLVSGLRTVYEPKVREHLEARDWSEEDIARVLSQPFRKLERTLNRIEREGR
ncbi:MAG: hypothetical protein ACI9EF_001238 [Pseudohongiellaceae bacterium]|jgi:hypothetical protein